MSTLTFDTIRDLHKKYAPSEQVFELVFTHCIIISEIAEQIIQNKRLSLDSYLVNSGALLHDIGAYKLINSEGIFDEENYIKHGIFGAEILRKEGLSEELARIAERHTGVGITKVDILNQQLHLPSKDFIAETTEEKLIMYADKFHTKSPRFNSFESYKKYIAKYGNEKVKKFEELSRQFGIPSLDQLATKYSMPIK